VSDPEEVAAALERLRRNIDEVDVVLVKLLNQRARWALEVGEVKGRADIPIYQPNREAEVLAAVEARNKGPLEHAAMRRLFERVIDESRRIERISGQEEELE
jgi:chorismate mutase